MTSPDRQIAMARAYADAHDCREWLEHWLTLDRGGRLMTLDRASVLAAILRGEVVVEPEPCATCGGDGTVCCGNYLGTGECCETLDGGDVGRPCPDCERGEGEDG